MILPEEAPAIHYSFSIKLPGKTLFSFPLQTRSNHLLGIGNRTTAVINGLGSKDI